MMAGRGMEEEEEAEEVIKDDLDAELKMRQEGRRAEEKEEEAVKGRVYGME